MRWWLVRIRENKGLSQYGVASRAGISQSYYALIETGQRGNPLNVNIAKQIATALSFDWTKFYIETETAQAKR